MRFGTYLVAKGLLTSDQVLEALDRQMHSRTPIGQLAQEAGKLNADQVFEILNLQAENRKVFGQIAVELGYLSALELADLLTAQKQRVKPIGEILVEMGLLKPHVLQAELSQYQRLMQEALDRLTVPASAS